MVSQIVLARQQRTASCCLVIPKEFPLPQFSFGDYVKTSEDDYGQIVGMVLVRHGQESFWFYRLDLTIDSPNFWCYQGDHFGSELAKDECDSPSFLEYPEQCLKSIKSLEDEWFCSVPSDVRKRFTIVVPWRV